MRRMTCVVLLAVLLAGAGFAHAMTLGEAVALAKSRSLAMENPRIDRLGVRGRIEEAWSNALPQIEGQVGYQRAFKSSKIFFPNPETGEYMALKLQQDNAVQADVTLTQPLLTFGRIAAGLRGAYAAKRANDHQLENTTRAVELETMRRFWTVLLAREVLEARRASLAIGDSSLARATRMREVGLLSDYDVLRVRVQAMNQRPPLQQAENNVALSELSLREWLGIPLDSSLTAVGELENFSLPLDTAAGLAGVLARDDLAALRELSTMQKNIYVIYRNAYWPTLGGQLGYSWSWQNDKWAMGPQNNFSSAYGGLSLKIPISTSGYIGGRAKQYKAEWRRSELAVRQAERGASLQYESSVRSYRTALENEDAARAAVSEATRSREIAQTRFSQGQLTPLEMDAAQLDELVAKVAFAQAKYDRLVAGAEVRMAAGLAPQPE